MRSVVTPLPGRCLAVWVGLGMVACTDTGARPLPIDPPPPGTVATPASFVTRETCTPLNRYSGPEPSTEFTYRRLDGSISSRRIMATRDEEIVFQYRDLSKAAQRPLPPTAAIAGLFVIGGEGSSRRTTYLDNPLDALATLAVGDEARIRAEETSTLRGETRTVGLTTTVRYVACGSLPVQGRDMPVRVYQVTSGRRIMGPDLQDRIRLSQVTYYLSDQLGYPLAVADPGTTSVVERIAPVG